MTPAPLKLPASTPEPPADEERRRQRDAERQRRQRYRDSRDLVSLGSGVGVPRACIEELVARGLLRPEECDDLGARLRAVVEAARLWLQK